MAAEDRRFYSHHGFDIKGIMRAMERDIASNEVIEGGSAITQQLAVALEKGMSSNDLILDEPVRIQDPDSGRLWSPRNSEDEY